MNTLGAMNGLLTTDFISSTCIFTILQEPGSGRLISFLVDDGDEINEYTYEKPNFYAQPGTDPLQWGLLA